MTTIEAPTRDLEQVECLAAELREFVQELRERTHKVSDPQVKALFETSAEVASGLLMAFHHYMEGSELAWK